MIPSTNRAARPTESQHNPTQENDPMSPAPVQQTANLMLDAKLTLTASLQEMERALISVTLERTKGNVCRAALALEVHRNTLNRKLKALQLKELPAKIRWEARHKLCSPPKLKWMAAA